MDRSKAIEIVRELRGQHQDALATQAAARQKAAAIETIIEGYLALFPDLEDDAPASAEPDQSSASAPREEDRPKGQDAVLRIMESIEWSGKYWTVRAMVDALTDRDWLPDVENPQMAVRSAMARAAGAHPANGPDYPRVHKGEGHHGALVYYYQAKGAPQPFFPGGPREDQPTGSALDGVQPSDSSVASDSNEVDYAPGSWSSD